jgi:hypothetical protein
MGRKIDEAAVAVATEEVVEIAATQPAPTGLALLRVDFPAHQISKLPRGGIMLDYVGHAALTDRLLDADPNWNWEPLALTPAGLPAVDEVGGLWIRLTVCGQTRLGYGHAGTKKGGDAVKELIGDALRNAAMRYGAALDLWHKGDLHGDDADAPTAPAGYDDWLLDFEAHAANGIEALGAAFASADLRYRQHYVSTVNPQGREALKAKARAVGA